MKGEASTDYTEMRPKAHCQGLIHLFPCRNVMLLGEPDVLAEGRKLQKYKNPSGHVSFQSPVTITTVHFCAGIAS